jgi:hypothetical protein
MAQSVRGLNSKPSTPEPPAEFVCVGGLGRYAKEEMDQLNEDQDGAKSVAD